MVFGVRTETATTFLQYVGNGYTPIVSEEIHHATEKNVQIRDGSEYC